MNVRRLFFLVFRIDVRFIPAAAYYQVRVLNGSMLATPHQEKHHEISNRK